MTVDGKKRIPRDGRTIVNVWILKYWSTSGVSIQECEQIPKDGGGFWYKSVSNPWANGYHHRGRDFALTADEAREAVHKLAAKKRASLTRTLAELDSKVEAALLVVEAVGRPLGGAASGPAVPETDGPCADD